MRTEQLKSIRPTIETKESDAGVYELFQNTTLRPILKFQHDLLLAVFLQYTLQHKTGYQDFKKGKKKEFIKDTLHKNVALKSKMAGLIIGHFTTEEYQIFIENESELMRRLGSLLIERLQSTVG
jgi:hypothetical protein